MGKATEDKTVQLKYLQNRLDALYNTIEAIDPDQVGLEDIDRLIQMVDDVEVKLHTFQKDWKK